MSSNVNYHGYAPSMGKYQQSKVADFVLDQVICHFEAPDEDFAYFDQRFFTPMRYTIDRVTYKNPSLHTGTGESFDSHGRTLPGRGEQTNSSCGKLLGYHECPDKCVPREPWQENCGISQCPVCFQKWINRRTKESGFRLEQAAILLGKSPRHVVVIPPVGSNPTKTERNVMARMLGITGALTIEHPWRFRALVDDSQIPYNFHTCESMLLYEQLEEGGQHHWSYQSRKKKKPTGPLHP